MIQLVVRAIIAYQGKYLLVKLVDEDFWCLPGGKVDGNEDMRDALRRELVEELGVTPRIGNLVYVHQLMNVAKRQQRLEFFFEVKNGGDYVAIDLAKTSHGGKELAAVEFLPLKGTNVLPAFLADELPTKSLDVEFRTSYLQ